MPRLLVNGNFATVPDAASEKGEHSYPVYIKRTGDGMLVINSFTGRVWHADGNELSKTSERAIAGRLALGPSPEELSQKAERAAAAALAQPAQIAFCPTYSCNMHCVYCYQQNNPALDKKTVSDEKLTRFLKYADSFVSESRSRRPDRAIVMQLFGGEPFSKATGPVIKKLFEFCRSRRMHIAATTNGLALDDHFGTLLPYHGYIGQIGITLDGVGEVHDMRRGGGVAGGFERIVRNINVLLKAGVQVAVSLTLDKNNIDKTGDFFAFTGEQGWNDNPLVEIIFSRVDDRKFESDYGAMFSESQLLRELLKIDAKKPFPKNTRAAFINTSLHLSREFSCSLRTRSDNREQFKYCWASSKTSNLVYIDPELDVFRCTCTVGDKRRKIGDLNSGFNLSAWYAHGTWNRTECAACPIGGFCSGGCRLSAAADFTRNCREEKENFDYFIEEIILPRLPDTLASGCKERKND